MTNLEKPLTRLCPDIKSEQGQELTATIQPSNNGGELLLHWNNDRKKADDRTFQLKDLAGTSEQKSHPAEWGTWLRTEDLKSQIMTSPGLDLDQKNLMCHLMDRVVLTRQWAESDTDLTWDEFLESRGRSDLKELSSDTERPELKEQREKQQAAQEAREKEFAQAKKVPRRQPNRKKKIR